MRKSLKNIVHFFLPLVLITGFFVAGISGGKSCNTFPMVGPNFFITKKHFNEDIPLWQNFTENKLVAQVNHRSLATLMALIVTWKSLKLLGMSGLSKSSKIASGILLASVWFQILIGVNTIWQGVPINLASSHQIGAMTVLSAFIFSMHTCRKVDPRHMKNLLGKLRTEDP